MQACDVLLEQINACAALPGRPKLEIPAGISREVRIKHCEIPSYVTPETPFDAALNLSFDIPRQDCTDRSKFSDPQIHSPGSEDCSSLPCSKNSQSQSLPKSESQVFSLVSQSSHVQFPDSGKVTDGCPDNALNDPSESELKPLHPSSIVAPVACVSETEDRVSKCSGSSAPDVPETQLRPINFISASYYVERPSNPQSFCPSNSTRRTSFCRIEAFVVRSKSVKCMPPQSRVGVPQFKK